MKSDVNQLDLALNNVEALAHLEDGCDNCHLDNYGREPRTERCMLDLGGGMFTSSVKHKKYQQVKINYAHDRYFYNN